MSDVMDCVQFIGQNGKNFFSSSVVRNPDIIFYGWDTVKEPTYLDLIPPIMEEPDQSKIFNSFAEVLVYLEEKGIYKE